MISYIPQYNLRAKEILSNFSTILGFEISNLSDISANVKLSLNLYL